MTRIHIGIENINMAWEDTFKSWTQPLSETEDSKCENAEKMIRGAIDEDPKLSSMDIAVFTQGSYRANTNVRQESDVDICVCLKSTFFYDFDTHSIQESPIDYGIYPSSTEFSDFKNWVENALVRKFGRSEVSRGNKAFDVHANTYRVDADIVPAFEHRRYTGRYNDVPHFHEGIEFKTDTGIRIINWPDQTHENGVNKNNLTSKRYKSIVRILKRLKCEMEVEKIPQATNIGSFLISSLVWNVPNEQFGYATLESDVRNILAHTFNNTLNDEDCKEWGEVNELKYLFNPQQGWTRQQAHNFLSAAWDYLGFE